MQTDDAWFEARRGIPTASCFGAVLARLKDNREAAIRRDYKFQLAIERLTDVTIPSFSNPAKEWGRKHENEAREAFELETGLLVEEIDFIRHPDINAGCSPDGLIGPDEGLEIKCPFNSSNHLETIMKGMPSKHKPQVQGALWITGRRRWHFVSYDPRMPEQFRLYRQTVNRDDKYIDNLAEKVIEFNAEIEALLAELKEKMT